METHNITIFGDICPAWGFPQQFATGNTEKIFHDILPMLNSADLVLANLEAPLTDCDERLKKNSVCLKGRPGDAAVLAKAGIDGVSLANNHILDYGIEGYRDTLNVLDKYEIFHYGTGESSKENRPVISRLGDLKIGILSFAEHEFNSAEDYGEGAYCWDDLTGPQMILNAKKHCDYLIIQYHGGIEHYIYPSPYLQKKCRMMADMGADFVTCQHSHCIGTRESWNGCEILYGQGNAIFGYKENNEAWNTGLLVQLDFEDELKVKYIPIVATQNGEALADAAFAEVILNKLYTDSEKITDDKFVKDEWIKFCNKQADMYLPMAFARGRIFNKLNRMTKGLLIRMLTKGTSRRDVMNLIRCDAHREVVQTILEKDFYAD